MTVSSFVVDTYTKHAKLSYDCDWMHTLLGCILYLLLGCCVSNCACVCDCTVTTQNPVSVSVTVILTLAALRPPSHSPV